MAGREAPAHAHIAKQVDGARGARNPRAPAQDARCLGAAAQLAAVYRTLRHGTVLQLQEGGAAAGGQPGAAPRAAAANRTGLPDRLKAGVEALSGISLDGVKVHHDSSNPAQLNALAYARGGDIHLAPGQERHLPHEAWHVVQQAQGRVKPTLQMKEGVSINDESHLEDEADAMGARAAAGPNTGMPAAAADLAAASPRRTAQRKLKIAGIDDADNQKKIDALKQHVAGKLPYKFLVKKHSEAVIHAKIEEMVTGEQDHGSFDLQDRFNNFLAKLAGFMEAPRSIEALAVNDVVEMEGGIVGVVREVEATKALVQSIRKLASPPSSREYARDKAEWIDRATLKKSTETVNLQKEAARPVRTFGLGGPPPPAPRTLTGSATSAIAFPEARIPVAPQPSTSSAAKSGRVVPKDLSFKPAAFHMNWNPDDSRAGAIYIRQMALVGLKEGFVVVATVPEKLIQEFYADIDLVEALENIQIRPVSAAHDPWAEDSGEFHTGGAIHIPARTPPGKDAPMETIPAAREQRGFFRHPSDRSDEDIARIGASVSVGRHQSQKIELAGALTEQADEREKIARPGVGERERYETPVFENASHIEGGNILTGTAANGQAYALVGRDGVEATRAILANRARMAISDRTVKEAIGTDYGILPDYIIFVEQPGEFHLDMAMVVMGPGQVIVNDCLDVFELQQEWMYENYARLKPEAETGEEFRAWQRLGEQMVAALGQLASHASRMFGYEQRAVADLVGAGMRVERVAGAFPGTPDLPGIALPGMNFLNGEGGIGADNQPFFVTNGGDPRAEAYVAKQYLTVLGTGLRRLYFIDPGASKISIETTQGGLGCRVKGEGSVVPGPGK